MSAAGAGRGLAHASAPTCLGAGAAAGSALGPRRPAPRARRAPRGAGQVRRVCIPGLGEGGLLHPGVLHTLNTVVHRSCGSSRVSFPGAVAEPAGRRYEGRKCWGAARAGLCPSALRSSPGSGARGRHLAAHQSQGKVSPCSPPPGPSPRPTPTGPGQRPPRAPGRGARSRHGPAGCGRLLGRPGPSSRAEEPVQQLPPPAHPPTAARCLHQAQLQAKAALGLLCTHLLPCVLSPAGCPRPTPVPKRSWFPAPAAGGPGAGFARGQRGAV